MLYAVLLSDNPGKADIRPRLMPAHLEFLERHRAEIRAAGPLMEPDGRGAGGLWLVEAPDAVAITALVELDPLLAHGSSAIGPHPGMAPGLCRGPPDALKVSLTRSGLRLAAGVCQAGLPHVLKRGDPT